MILKRDVFSKDGIFGKLSNLDNSFLIQTLEHAYLTTNSKPPDFYEFLPKVPPGIYKCVRGIHQLKDPKDPKKLAPPFETFEITNVPNHDKILFHPGNTMEDSLGCILTGLSRQGSMILQSRSAFELFLENVKYIDSFDLEVS